MGLTVSKDFLPALKVQLKVFGSEVKRSLERVVIKDAKQEEKRIEMQARAFARSKNLLIFLNMLCENHNARAQMYLHKQSETRNIDIVALTVHFLHAVTESMPDVIDYVKDREAVKAFYVCGGGRHAIGESVASVGGLSKLKMVAWYNYAPADLKQLSQLFVLTGTVFATLTEFVQGPSPTNQIVLARAHACHTMVPIFEFLLSLQLEGKLHKVAWKGSVARGQGGLVSLLLSDSGAKGVQLPEGSAERDSAEKWLQKFEGKGGDAFRDQWVDEERNLLQNARAMELQMLALLTGMLEGETDVG